MVSSLPASAASNSSHCAGFNSTDCSARANGASSFGDRAPASTVARNCTCTSFSFSFAVNADCRSEEHTSELQSRRDLVCRLLLEKKKKNPIHNTYNTKKNITTI